jgi:hypothetical protein
LVKRSKLLPFGGQEIKYDDLVQRLNAAQREAMKTAQVRWGSAKDIWPEHYKRLTSAKFGMLGALTDRGAPHVLRLAMIYALLDKKKTLDEDHLLAALEVWRYCEDSAKHIFGTVIGDDTADAILRKLKRLKRGLTRTEIYIDVFSKNRSSTDITRALDLLEREGLVECEEIVATGGRPKEIWHATE